MKYLVFLFILNTTFYSPGIEASDSPKLANALVLLHDKIKNLQLEATELENKMIISHYKKVDDHWVHGGVDLGEGVWGTAKCAQKCSSDNRCIAFSIRNGNYCNLRGAGVWAAEESGSQYYISKDHLIKLNASKNNNFVDSSMIANRTIKNEDIAFNSIGFNEVSENAIHSKHINNRTIQNEDIAHNSIGYNEIQENAVRSEHIAHRTIQNQDIAFDSIGFNEIQENAVRSEHIAHRTIQNQDIAFDSIGFNEIQEDAVRSEHLDIVKRDCKDLNDGYTDCSCHKNEIILSGGGWGGSDGYSIQESRPVSDTTWRLKCVNYQGYDRKCGSFTILCVKAKKD